MKALGVVVVVIFAVALIMVNHYWNKINKEQKYGITQNTSCIGY